ncbi:MAG: hypothetical protein DHS20C15_25440 [Planctomycetota bacterium]|nr:MAG: hypothetical protein DHS20C15_25440 [Planctomycetota bacterium]
MSGRYPILAAEHAHEEILRRSRFLTLLAPVESEDQARAFLAARREAGPDANHHCWAYLIGPPGSSSRVGRSDAGEPSGTAGRPMLDVLTHSGVGDIVAVCSRWFGGTLLGRGGLVQAYGGGVKAALENAPLTEKVHRVELELDLDYATRDAVRRLYPVFEVELLEEGFGVGLLHRLRLPAERELAFAQALLDLSNGQLVPRPIGD